MGTKRRHVWEEWCSLVSHYGPGVCTPGCVCCYQCLPLTRFLQPLSGSAQSCPFLLPYPICRLLPHSLSPLPRLLESCSNSPTVLEHAPLSAQICHPFPLLSPSCEILKHNALLRLRQTTPRLLWMHLSGRSLKTVHHADVQICFFLCFLAQNIFLTDLYALSRLYVLPWPRRTAARTVSLEVRWLPTMLTPCTLA